MIIVGQCNVQKHFGDTKSDISRVYRDSRGAIIQYSTGESIEGEEEDT